MGDIQFETSDASALARVARRAADTLRGQAGPRSGAVASALDDAAGSYADRFREAAVVEAEDRARLAGVLVDLADQIDAAVAAAERERKRQRDHAEWKARDADRKRAASVAEAFAGPQDDRSSTHWSASPIPSRRPNPSRGRRSTPSSAVGSVRATATERAVAGVLPIRARSGPS